MTTSIVLNIIFAVLAVTALAALTRLAHHVAGGRFEQLPEVAELEQVDVLERAA